MRHFSECTPDIKCHMITLGLALIKFVKFVFFFLFGLVIWVRIIKSFYDFLNLGIFFFFWPHSVSKLKPNSLP